MGKGSGSSACSEDGMGSTHLPGTTSYPLRSWQESCVNGGIGTFGVQMKVKVREEGGEVGDLAERVGGPARPVFDPAVEFTFNPVCSCFMHTAAACEVYSSANADVCSAPKITRILSRARSGW